MHERDDREQKVYEDRLRRMAKRQRLIATKSRARDENSFMYNQWKIVDAAGKFPVAGFTNSANAGYCLDDYQVENFLTKRDWR
jgi:hypothetical protein